MKGYRPETLFLAINIADRYLALMAVFHNMTPSLIELGVISILLAAKINEHLSPSYYNLIKIINSQQRKKLLSRSNLLVIEVQVLKALKFDVHSTTILFFLERYMRIFELKVLSERDDGMPTDSRRLREERRLRNLTSSASDESRERNKSMGSTASEELELKDHAKDWADQSLDTIDDDKSLE